MSKHHGSRQPRHAASGGRRRRLSHVAGAHRAVSHRRTAAHAARPHKGAKRKKMFTGLCCVLTVLTFFGMAPFWVNNPSPARPDSSIKTKASVRQATPALEPTADSTLKVAASVSDWPMWRNNAQRSGSSAAQASFHRYSVNSLRQKWRQGLRGLVTSSAAVAADSVFIGSHDGSLYALNVHTGVAKWQYRTNGSIESSPAIMDSKVFFTSSDGALYALDAATGRLLWSKSDRYSVSSPLISQGATQADSRLYVGSASGEVHAYTLDGNLLWKYTTGGAIESSPTLVTLQGGEHLLLVGSDDHYVHALSLESHQAVWKFETHGSVTATPAADGFRAYVGSRDGSMYALDLHTGAPLWTYSTEAPITSSATVSDANNTESSRIYFGSQSGTFYAIESIKGVVSWSATFASPIVSSPALGAGVLYVGVGNSIVSLSSATGQSLWSSVTGGPVNSSPSLSASLLVVGSADNCVYAFSLPGEDMDSPETSPTPPQPSTNPATESSTPKETAMVQPSAGPTAQPLATSTTAKPGPKATGTGQSSVGPTVQPLATVTTNTAPAP
ncbi:beta-alanine-activating enzyme beta-propeller domain-containing protein [Streptomyces sp. 900105245]